MSNQDPRAGVWAVTLRDYYENIERVYETEVEALRWINEMGSGKVRFIPWGMSLVELDEEH